MGFISTQPVYFDMLDALHVMHNGVYVTMFERARLDLSDALDAEYGERVFDWPYFVARNEINYRKPIYDRQTVTVEVGLRALGTTSTTFSHVVRFADGTVAADGDTVIVHINEETRRPEPWSAAFRERIARALGAPPASGSTTSKEAHP